MCDYNELFMACHNNDNDKVKQLLNTSYCSVDNISNHKINEQNKNGNTILICAVLRKNTDIVKMLINHKNIDVNIQNKQGNTSLIYATIQRQNEITNLILDKINNSKYLNIENCEKVTPLKTILRFNGQPYKRIQIINQLLEKYFDLTDNLIPEYFMKIEIYGEILSYLIYGKTHTLIICKMETHMSKYILNPKHKDKIKSNEIRFVLFFSISNRLYDLCKIVMDYICNNNSFTKYQIQKEIYNLELCTDDDYIRNNTTHYILHFATVHKSPNIVKYLLTFDDKTKPWYININHEKEDNTDILDIITCNHIDKNTCEAILDNDKLDINYRSNNVSFMKIIENKFTYLYTTETWLQNSKLLINHRSNKQCKKHYIIVYMAKTMVKNIKRFTIGRVYIVQLTTFIKNIIIENIFEFGSLIIKRMRHNIYDIINKYKNYMNNMKTQIFKDEIIRIFGICMMYIEWYTLFYVLNIAKVLPPEIIYFTKDIAKDMILK